MQTVEFGRWCIEADQSATSLAYQVVGSGAPESCGCAHCRNFSLARAVAYPPSVLALFEQLGIRSSGESEVYHLDRESNGLHLYGGWFHFAGKLISGRDAMRQIAANSGTYELEAVTPGFGLGITRHLGLVPKAFAGLPVLQLEFRVYVPWILAEGEVV